MARLILHSDDFGLHPQVNRAILEAAERGALTSASLMANGLASRAALEDSRGQLQLGVGLHLNVVRGRPLSAPEAVPSLVDRKGHFLNSPARLLLRSWAGRLSAEEVHREYRLQLLYMLDHGREPTHFDGEKHSHLWLPEGLEAVRRLQQEFGIPRVRIVRERPMLRALRAAGVPVTGSWRQRAKLTLLEHRGRQASRRLLEARHPTLSYGVLESGSLCPERALRVLEVILRREGDEAVEWMFHLGYPFDAREPAFAAEFGSFFLELSRTRELEFLLSPAVSRLLDGHRDRLISYREL